MISGIFKKLISPPPPPTPPSPLPPSPIPILTLELTVSSSDDKYMRHLNLEPKSVLREIGPTKEDKSGCS